MFRARLFLLEISTQRADVLTPLKAALTQAGHTVTTLLIDPDLLDGSDACALRVLHEIRAAKTGPSAIVVGVGLAASFALWMDAVDLPKPKTVRIGAQAVTLDNEWEFGQAMSGVIAIHPFLGFDFSLSGRPKKAEGFTAWRLERCRGGAWAGLFGGAQIRSPADHGCAAEPAVTWGDLGRCLPFSSVAKVVPSLKRPTVVILDAGAGLARAEVELCALSGRVQVMDSPAVFPQLAHVTLAAVDSLEKGSTPTDG